MTPIQHIMQEIAEAIHVNTLEPETEWSKERLKIYKRIFLKAQSLLPSEEKLLSDTYDEGFQAACSFSNGDNYEAPKENYLNNLKK